MKKNNIKAVEDESKEGFFGLQAQILVQNVHLKSTLRSGHCSSVFLPFLFFSDQKSAAADSVFVCLVLEWKSVGRGEKTGSSLSGRSPKVTDTTIRPLAFLFFENAK